MIGSYIEKGFTPSDVDLEKIRQYTQKDFDKSELFIFNIVLCNNDVDRDFEKFSVSSLNEMKTLFVGKTGILDHSMKASDQKARIFDTFIEKSNDRKTLDGEELYLLKAKAYMVRNEENGAFITDIEAGIKKEVSVSLSVSSAVCSVCGANKRERACNHINGKSYDGKVAFSVLNNVTDAYEWSFVAVPAQKDAGVTKSYNFSQKEVKMNDIIKSLNNAESDLTITKSEAREILSYIESLKDEASLGKEYKENLQNETIKLCALNMPNMDIKVFEGVARVMTTSELKCFINAFKSENKSKEQIQLKGKTKEKIESINQFMI